MNENEVRKILEDTRSVDMDQDETFRSMVSQSFRSSLRWIVIICWIYIFVFAALAIVSAAMFFRVETTRDMILYATAFLFCMGIVSGVKLWYWNFMNRNSLRREIKRLELTVLELRDSLRS